MERKKKLLHQRRECRQENWDLVWDVVFQVLIAELDWQIRQPRKIWLTNCLHLHSKNAADAHSSEPSSWKNWQLEGKWGTCTILFSLRIDFWKTCRTELTSLILLQPQKKNTIKLVKRMTSIEEVRSYLSVESQCSSHYDTSQSHSNVNDYTFAVYTHLPPGYRWCFCRAGRCGTELPGSRASTSSAGATPVLLGGNMCWAPPCATCKRLQAESVSMKNAQRQEN